MSLKMHTPEGGQAQHHSVSYDGKIAGLYDLERTLGSGHFAVVKLARHVFTGEKVAVKVVDKTKLDEVSKAHLFQEVRCMKLVQHPNVVRLYEVIDTQTKLYLILELGDGGDLYDYIMKHEGGLSEDLARKYFRQIVRAISYCHQLHVVHRDLKPANVVFFEKAGVVKLTDFGFSNKFLPGQKLETSCGSLAYSAPEILLGDSYDAQAVDIWSLGVILYMLVCGQPPFEKANDSETLTMIMDCKYSMPSHVTVTCRRLIASMLVRDPEKRATLEQISQDVWLKQNSSGAEPLLDHLPLVSHEQVSEDDHAFIIQKMINGNIATKEDIMQSLDRNKYNHITATYYLLAERRLRQKRQEQVQKHRPLFLPASPGRLSSANRSVPEDNKLKSDQGNKLLVPVNIEVCNSIEFTSEAVTEKRNRKCSIVKEEDEEEAFECPDKSESKVSTNRRASIADARINRAVQERSVESQYMSKLVIKPIAPNESSNNAFTVEKWDSLRLDSNKKSQNSSMPKKSPGKSDILKQPKVHQPNPPLNELQEAGGIVEQDDFTELQHDLSGIKDLEISKMRNKNPVLMHRRTKLNKMRTPSCSSSEASDDEAKSKKKKIHKIGGDTPNRFRVNRRDSYDDSSDSQDQANLGSGQSNTNIVLSNSKDEKSGSGKKEEQSKAGEPQNSHSKQKKGCSLMENCLPKVGGRRRLRESQSLDRITESQEYEQRQRYNNLTCNNYNESVVTQFQNMSLNSNSVPEQAWTIDKMIRSSEDKISQEPKSGALKNTCDMNSIEEIDLYIGMNVTKAIQTTGSKYSVTMKKIRRLGKYFPVINLS
ncbi:SNF-related serine/threonine-protein kinase [Eupeodes corollae]|uniref:SNF-related serine/threonine-protein kinase n=1 Tax=Eupeodes corollae TaxID=290404 RepID=UPI00248F8A01|nr:SNF-related serine/threonine-protein kinase [Eupeodes corollae]XP_055917915.1 SNF-related serine/threonine-protein kinase [Eupeodes corollae]